MGVLSGKLQRARLNQAAPWVHGDVLDLGCGPSEILDRVGDRITSYTGIDLKETRVARVQRMYPDHRFFQRNLDDDAIALDRQFDTVLMLALVEHIYNQKHLFQEITGVLKPGGAIVITTPTPFGNDIVHSLGARAGLFSKIAADDHVVIYNRNRFEIVARDFGLTLAHYRTFQLGCNQLAVLKRPGP